MSVTSVAAVPAKRGFNDTVAAPASPTHCVGRGGTAKRYRLGPGSPVQQGGLGHNVPLRTKFPLNPDSPFNVFVPQEPLEMHLDKAMLRQSRQKGAEHSKFSGRNTEGCEGHVFTMEQVRTLVARAVEERERRLRATFDPILQAKLESQYLSFTKFNACNIKRQLRDSTFDYMC